MSLLYDCVAINDNCARKTHNPFSEYTVWAMAYSGSNLKTHVLQGENPRKSLIPIQGVKQVLQTFGNQTTIISAEKAGCKIVAFLDVSDKSQENKMTCVYIRVYVCICMCVYIYTHSSRSEMWDICTSNAILNAFGGHKTTLNKEESAPLAEMAMRGTLKYSRMNHHQALVKKISDLEMTGHK